MGSAAAQTQEGIGHHRNSIPAAAAATLTITTQTNKHTNKQTPVKAQSTVAAHKHLPFAPSFPPTPTHMRAMLPVRVRSKLPRQQKAHSTGGQATFKHEGAERAQQRSASGKYAHGYGLGGDGVRGLTPHLHRHAYKHRAARRYPTII